jgi:DNA polymerase III subunit epsilon
VAAQRDQHFLARVVDKMPRVSEPPHADAYLALLDQALLDRRICAREADDLVAVAHRLGLDRAVLDRLHRGYLATLATVAWGDGVLTDCERADLHTTPRDHERDEETTHTVGVGRR